MSRTTDCPPMAQTEGLPAGVLRQAAKLRPLMYVAAREVGIVNFRHCPMIRTSGLSGGTVVALRSEQGAILAHIPPGVDAQYVRVMMGDVRRFRDEAMNFFPGYATMVSIACARDQDQEGKEMPVPEQVAIVEQAVKEMGYAADEINEYDARENRQGEDVPAGSMLIVKRDIDANVRIWCEDFELPRAVQGGSLGFYASALNGLKSLFI